MGLDEYEVLSVTNWYRHITLGLWTLACGPGQLRQPPSEARPVPRWCRFSLLVRNTAFGTRSG